MKLRKRLLAALLSLCMMLALMPTAAADLLDEVRAEARPRGETRAQTKTMVAELSSCYPETGDANFYEDQSNTIWMLKINEDFAWLETHVGEWFIVVYDEGYNVLEVTAVGNSSGSNEVIVSEPTYTEPSASVYIDIKDIERNGDTYRVANSGDAFQDAAAFRLPVTVTVTNTSGHSSSDSHSNQRDLSSTVIIGETVEREYEAAFSTVTKGDGASPAVSVYGGQNNEEIEIRSVELKFPNYFTLEQSQNNLNQPTTLAPGESEEYSAYLKFSDSHTLIQTKDLKYSISATVKTGIGEFKSEGSFTVYLAENTASEDDGYSYEEIPIPLAPLDEVTDPASAVKAVEAMTGGMTKDQKESPVGIDVATLYAETAAYLAVSKTVSGGNIILSKASVADLVPVSERAVKAVDAALASGGIVTGRELFKTVTFKTDSTNLTIQIEPDLLESGAEKVRVETPSFGLTFRVDELKEDLTETLTITAQAAGVENYARTWKRNQAGSAVKVNFSKGGIANPMVVSVPFGGGDYTYKAVVNSSGDAVSSKYNPVTTVMDGRVNTSGTYSPKTNQKNFSDISGKSAEMQKAILYLTSKGIISGTSSTTFSPDNSISRQQIAALMVRALGKVDNTATATFTDVPKTSSLYYAIASSQRHKIINGYSDNTFRGTSTISKAQIVTVSGRVLTSEMKYKTPSNTGTYLGKYSDTVPAYAQDMVALATREGLVVYRTDGTFSGDKNMTRGDAAVILYRLFQRIW